MNAVAKQNVRRENNGKAAVAEQERSFVAPDVNIYETEDAFVIQAEMPGVAKDGLEVTLEGGTLTFTGRRDDEAVHGDVLYRESRGADYRRSFELDPVVDTEKVSAEMTQGVLTITLPKAERVKPRRIQIK